MTFSGEVWEHHGEDVAESSGNTWSLHDHSPGDPDDLALTDAGIFLATASGYVPNEYNKAVFYDADDDMLRQGHFISWSYNVAQPVNGQVCRTGWKSFGDPQFRPCGRIHQVDHWQWSCKGPGTTPPCAAIDHEWKVDFDTTAGDSGAPTTRPRMPIGMRASTESPRTPSKTRCAQMAILTRCAGPGTRRPPGSTRACWPIWM